MPEGKQAVEMKPVLNFPKYLVSEEGEIYTLYDNKFLKKAISDRGYYKVQLVEKGKKLTLRVHRIVAFAFVPNPHGHNAVNHKDGNKLNNHAPNLEWCTNSENQRHAIRLGLKKPPSPLKRPVRAVNLSTGEARDFPSLAEAARVTGACSSKVGAVCLGRRSKSGGHRFAYL